MKYLITSALPYINGIKHLGNLVGSMLPADVYARFLRQQGEEVLYICGTDEHGTPAELAAQKTGASVAKYCEDMYAVQKGIYEQFSISFDYFGRSSAPSNVEVTQSIFKALDDNGFIEERDISQVYSIDDKRYLPDRYVEGTCPHCGYEMARGDQCDNCGKLLDPTDLINPYSAVSGSHNVEVRQSRHLFLNLTALQTSVAEWVDSHDNWPTVTKGIARKWLQEGLQERCITRDLKWGVPVPKAGFEDKVFYVWFDAPNAYIAMSKDWAEQKGEPEAWRDWWFANDDVNYTQFMAKDNVPFHAIFWPAMLLGADQNWKLADQIKSVNWLTYAGGKFSTSQQRGVFTDIALQLFPVDYWRYYLVANTPESDDTDFSFEHFASVINKDLADILGNFVNRVVALLRKYSDSKVPELEFVADAELVAQHNQCIDAYNSAMRELKLRQAAQAVRSLWVLANEYITREQPWKLAKQDMNAALQVLMNCLVLIRSSAVLASNIMPNTAKTLFDVLGEGDDPAHVTLESLQAFEGLPAGQALSLSGNLFTKIEEPVVADLTERFSGAA